MNQDEQYILAVDDEPELLGFLVDALKHLGYKNIFSASTGEDAWTLFKENPQITLLISDVAMPPRLSGYKLAKKINKKNPDVKIILTSGYSRKALSNAGQEMFQLNMLPKPYDIEELDREIRAALF